MKLQDRSLVLGMQGNDVRELQRELVWLSFDIASPEITSGKFGETTQSAVQVLNKPNGRGTNSEVDARTVEAINQKLGALTRMVRGNVRQADAKPSARVKVRAFDKGLRTKTMLGEATTDAAGFFEIHYVFSAGETDAPNLFLKAFAATTHVKALAVSPVMFDAEPDVVIDLVIGNAEYRGPSEFERLMKELQPVVDRQHVRMADLVEDAKIKDVTFLSGATRNTADRVAHAVLAHRHAKKSGREPEVHYAFMRQGLPTEPSALLSQDPSILRRALVQAVADNVIPQGFETEAKLTATLAGLQEWRATVALQDPADSKQVTLGTLVKGILTDPAKQKRFMQALATHEGTVDDFWKTLERDAQLAPRVPDLKFTVLLANLGLNSQLIDVVRSTPKLKQLKDLASLNADAWLTLITRGRVGTPLGTPGTDDADKARRYARSLADAVEAAAPTDVFVARLKSADVQGKQDLLKFFQANPAFDVKNTRLQTYLNADPRALDGLRNKPLAVAELKALQRTYRLAQSAEPAMALHAAGRHSAHSISRMGQNAFVASFGQHFADTAQASATHTRAQQVSASAIALMGDVNPTMGRVAMHAVPDTVARSATEIPRWASLFEPLDVTSCEQCQSVHGPSAYLVDLLNFLEHRKAKLPVQDPPLDPATEPPSVKEILFARRPDLRDIELTCENTNTVLPYVDLVAEVLEDAVAPPPDFTAFELDTSRIPDLDQGRVSVELRAAFAGSLSDHVGIRVKRPGEWWMVDDLSFSYSVRTQANGKPNVDTRSRQTRGPQAELAANPQYVNLQAYATLKEAVFPWTLPFDQSLEEARAYLKHLGVPRHQIVEAFSLGERSTVLGNAALAAEYLGLSSKEAGLVTGADPSALALQWGTVEATLLDEIKKVDVFLQRSNLAYREMLDLLQTRYVNTGSSVTIVSTDVDHPETSDPTKLAMQGLTANIANRIVRFVRLWRKLGWTMFELDRAISALGGDLTAQFLVQSSHLSRLRARFHLSVGRLSAFWAPLDTVRYTNHGDASKPLVASLYDQLFRSRGSINPLDLGFTEDPAALTGNLTDRAPAIAAALEINSTDLAAILQCDKVFPQGIDIALNLDHLSRLYRHVALAKALHLRVQDYLRALELIDDAPFTDTTRTVLFVESIAQVRSSGFTLAELDYLLRHESVPSSRIALEERVIVDRLRDLRQDLQKGAAKEAIARKLAATLRLELRTLGLLEPQWAALMDPALAAANDEDLIASNFPQQFAGLVRLHKISVIATRFRMSAEMLEWLLNHDAAEGLLDLTALPTAPATADFQKWTRLVNLLALRPAFFRREQGLLELLELAHHTPAPTRAELLAKLVEQTEWNGTDLEFLAGAEGLDLTLPDDLEHEKALLHLRDCFAVLKRLGISAEQARKLSVDDVTAASARAVRQAVRAKYDEPGWLAIAKPLRDVLREKQRSALVDHLIAQGLGEDANALYGHFLIDVEMDACMMTSRTKQAISSVQLFVQRCLMNLEKDVLASAEADDAWGWWKWMKNYRVWEANRKVFLYPENWIEPELRDDKSPFFKELESELQQSDLTLETAETAFLNYLEKVDQVSRLEVMAVHHEKDNATDILHVFARTPAPPRVYYHRRRVDSTYWTPWEKMDVDIEGSHLVPVMWNSRLFLFWPMFTETAEPMDVRIPPSSSAGHVNAEPRKYWDMKLAWSERKQGKWTGKKVSSDSAKVRLNTGGLPDLSRVFFASQIFGNDLAIYQYYVTRLAGQPQVAMKMKDEGDSSSVDPLPPEPPVPHYVTGSQNQFSFGGCYLDPLITPFGFSGIGSGQNVLVGSERSYMSFSEMGNAALNLPVRTSVDNSQAALALTPGRYRVTSQGAEPRVARKPFLFQDPWRNYLIVPRVSWWDDVVIDPSEIGGVMTAERIAPTFTPAPAAHNGSGASVVVTTAASTTAASTTTASTIAASTTAASTIAATALAPGLSELTFSAETALGPDTHGVGPFGLRSNTKYTFHNLYHPYVCALIYTLNRQGVDHMLGREMQLHPHLFLPGGASATQFSFESVYGPSTDLVAQPYPIEEMDFSFSDAYSSYNWELFFHAPLLIADRLSKNQRFEDATRWFHYIFNPTDTSTEDAPKRYWQTKEFFEKTDEDYQRDRLGNLFTLLAGAKALREKPVPTPGEQEQLRRLDDLEASIKAWRNQPFKPHLVARTRTTAYQKSVVMKYIDNLIAWGDQLFRRDTLETLNEATQLYVLAAEILGTRPVEVPPRLTPRVQTYRSIEAGLDAFSNALVEIEELIPVDPDPGANLPEQQPPLLLYFGLPKNDKLVRYWDTVADRLFKVRHCMNIEGVVRQLPLFEPPIDPALLVRAAAAGLDINSLLTDAAAPLPNYRFSVLAQKATELCGELRSLGGALLATLEKRDAEELSLLRARHETGLLEKIEQVREEQLQETAEQSQALLASRNVIVGRLAHYQRLLGDSDTKAPKVGDRVQEKEPPRFSDPVGLAGIKMFPHEVVENLLLTAAQELELVSAAQKTVGAVLYALPEINALPLGVGITWPGGGNTQNAAADGTGVLATAAHFGASMASRLGSYITRELDWVLQHNQAAREIMQIDKQIIAAEIRMQIAAHELQNHRRQMADAREVEDFMQDKYTSQELYSWMVGQMSGVYFQTYQLAYETAKRTEQCYRHELGVRDASFVQFGYWDSLKKGLMAGEKLHHDLKRMEVAYLEQNRREFELTKHVSLEQLDPLALVRLRETGRCDFSLPEEAFDLDYPGHYFRRMKSASLTVPCVMGTYPTMSCTLRLLHNSIRISSGNGNDGYPRNTDGQGVPVDDERFVENLIPTNAIAASNGQNDSGVFELSFRDERYLPFEGAGAISKWSLELFSDHPANNPDPTNPDFGKPLRQFDYGTISDVMLHIKYTAREDAGTFKDGAVTHLREHLSKLETTPSLRLFNLRQEFPSAWQRFLQPANPAGGNIFELEMARNLFPFRDRDKTLKVNSISFLARCTNVGTTPHDYNVHMTLPSPLPQLPAEVDMTLGRASHEFGGLYFHQEGVATLPPSIAIAPTDPPVRWRLRMTHADGGDLQEDPLRNVMEVEEALLVLGYEWKDS